MSLNSETSSSRKNEGILHRYPNMITADFNSIIRWRPHLSNLSRNGYITITGIIITYTLLDKPISEWLYDKKKNFMERQLDNLTHYTENPLTYGVLGTALGIVIRDKRLTDTGFTILEGAIFAEGIVGQLKLLTGRARPVQNHGSSFFKPLHRGYSSLPSGHTIHVCTAASIISEYYPKTKIFVYGIAGCIGLQRILIGAHWPTDVITAALLGHFIGKKLAQSHLKLYPVRFSIRKSEIRVGIPF